jgi:hypothetical protein
MIAKSAAAADHGWFGSEAVKTRLGTFGFKGSYPAGETTMQLREALAFNRAVEAYRSNHFSIRPGSPTTSSR